MGCHVRVLFPLLTWGFPKIGGTPKWNGENNGNPLFFNGWFGGETHYFRKPPFLVGIMVKRVDGDLPYKSTKCRYIYHTWMVWDMDPMLFWFSIFHPTGASLAMEDSQPWPSLGLPMFWGGGFRAADSHNGRVVLVKTRGMNNDCQ